MRRSMFGLGAVIVVLFFSIAPATFAQSNGAGIGIKPATIEDLIDPGTTERFVVNISNLGGKEDTYYIYVRDIIGASDSGVPIFAPEERERTEFEVSNWISLETNSFTLGPNQSRDLYLDIAVPAAASPGTHFGGVFVSVDPPELQQSGAAVGYEVANIIAIRVAGEVDETASIRQFSTDSYIYGSPNVTFNVKIENGGNTLIRPWGPMVIKNMFGTKVAELTFNENQGGVFPGNVRDFMFTWEGETPGFGRYEARVSPVFGEDGARQTLSSTVTFWILPMNIIMPAFGILAVLLLITYGIARLYVRRTLAQYAIVQQTRRISRRNQNNSSAFVFVFLVMIVVTLLFLAALVVLFA